MRKREVELGAVYWVKVSDCVVPVRLDRESPFGGWDGTNLHTNRHVRIRSAARLRGRVLGPTTTTENAVKEPTDRR